MGEAITMTNQTQSAKSYQRWQVSRRQGIAVAHAREQIQQEQIMQEIDGNQAIIDAAVNNGKRLSAFIVNMLEKSGYFVPDEIKSQGR